MRSFSRGFKHLETATRRAEVHRRAKIIDEKRVETKAENLTYWENYREMKVELVREYIVNMKIRKRKVLYFGMIINLNIMNKLSKWLKILQR